MQNLSELTRRTGRQRMAPIDPSGRGEQLMDVRACSRRFRYISTTRPYQTSRPLLSRAGCVDILKACLPPSRRVSVNEIALSRVEILREAHPRLRPGAIRAER
jgi:hypothetical protein